MSDTPSRGYLRRTSEGLKPRDDLAAPATTRPTVQGRIATPAGPAAPAPELEATAATSGQDSEEKLASSMVVAVSMPDAKDREKAILAALDKGSAAFPKFAKRFPVVGSKAVDKDPPQYRVYLQTGNAELRKDGGESAAKALVGEILVSTGVRLRDSEYIAVLLPIADKENLRSIAATAANQWQFHQQAGS